jgi:transposase
MKPLDLIRKRPAWVFPSLAGLVITGVLVYQQRSLEQMAESVRLRSTAPQVQALGERLAALEQFKDAQLKRPNAVTLEQVSELQAVLEARLSELDAQLAERAQISDLQVLRDIVASLGISMQKLEAEKTGQRPAKRPASKPTPKAPPFTVHGIEVRGGHRFVAISPPGKVGPEHIQLLRVGDQHLGWRLEAIEPQAVVFQVDGQSRRLSVR